MVVTRSVWWTWNVPVVGAKDSEEFGKQTKGITWTDLDQETFSRGCCRGRI